SFFYQKAILKGINKITVKPDIIYVHFVYNAIPVLAYAKENNIPVVVASGESTYAFWNEISPRIQKDLKEQINSVICVSKENQEQLSTLGFERNKMTIIPNAVDYTLFRPLTQKLCR